MNIASMNVGDMRGMGAVPAAPMRDTRIDVFRALALLTIFINHVPGTIYENFTTRNFGFSDSAEGFVLISGMAIALAYGSKFAPGNRLLLSLKMWRRAGVLYITHIMTTMVTIAIFASAALFLKRPDLLTEINIAPLVKQPVQALFGIVTLATSSATTTYCPCMRRCCSSCRCCCFWRGSACG